MSTERHEWVWKDPPKGFPHRKKLIPWSEISDKKIESLYRYFQVKQLKHLNISQTAEVKCEEIEDEAQSRGLKLIGIQSAYHLNEKKGKQLEQSI